MRRRLHKRHSASTIVGLSIHDWNLLILLCAYGLVLGRLVLIMAVRHAPCAEAIASAGYIDSGMLSGQNIWSLLYATTALSALYALAIIIISDTQSFTLNLFRGFMLSGLVVMTLGYRSMIDEYALPADAYIHVNLEAEPKLYGRLNPQWVKFEFEPVLKDYIPVRAACVYIRRGKIVRSDPNRNVGTVPLSSFQKIFGIKGSLIHALSLTEATVTLSDQDMQVINDIMQAKIDAYPIYPDIRQTKRLPKALDANP